MTAAIAYIGLGTNLGHRERNLSESIAKLRATPGVEVSRVSAYLENPAVGGPEGSPSFLNAVAELHTTISAQALLNRLLEIEKEIGRVRRDKWEARLIDLDVLLYGEQTLSSRELTVPHPLMHERDFVLKPLAELAPDLVHPTLGMTIRDLLLRLEK